MTFRQHVVEGGVSSWQVLAQRPKVVLQHFVPTWETPYTEAAIILTPLLEFKEQHARNEYAQADGDNGLEPEKERPCFCTPPIPLVFTRPLALAGRESLSRSVPLPLSRDAIRVQRRITAQDR